MFFPLALKILSKTTPSMATPLHSMSRTTFATTIVKGGQKINVLPCSSRVDIDCRLLPGQDFNYAEKHIKKALGKKLTKEVEITLLKDSLANIGSASPLNTEFVDAIKRTFQKLIPNSSVVPVIAYGATDLRYIRQNGGNGYGFSLVEPKTPAVEISEMAHNVNERVRIKSVELTIKAMYELAKEYLS